MTCPSRVAVIGAGIAGASVARALIAAGVEIIVIESDRPGAGASGFPAALVTPRLDAGDTGIADLHARALRRAGSLYGQIPGAVIGRSVLQLGQAERDPARFAKVAAQTIWSPGEMAALKASEVSDRLGEPVDVGGLEMASALTVRPAAVLNAWFDGAPVISGTAAGLEPSADGWRILDADGAVLVEAETVVIAAGWGSARLSPDLDLKPVRGQADWVEGPTPPATAWGGYVAPTGDGFLFGATHDRGDEGVDVRAGDSDRNRHRLEARLPRLAAEVATTSSHARAAVRATTRDRLPICGPVPGMERVFVLSGFGSRGFCVAPLLGEHLAALIIGATSPLPLDLAHRTLPDRFS